MMTAIRIASLSLLVLVASCSDPRDEYPLDVPDRGLNALHWGMSAEAARAHVLEMEGVRAGNDSTIVLPGGYFPTFVTPDTVRIRTASQPERSYRWMDFSGGRFLGYDVERWTLQFTGPGELSGLIITLAPVDRNKRRQFLLGQELESRHARPAPYYRLPAYYMTRFAGSPDTSGIPDTHVVLWPEDNGSLELRYQSLAHVDSISRWYDDHPLRKMHIPEYKALLEKEGLEPDL